MLGSKGWRSDESTRLPPMWPSSNPGVEAICGLSLLLVLSFAPRDFSPGTPVSPLLFDQEWGRQRTTLWMCYLQIIIYLFIYLFIYLCIYVFIYLFIYLLFFCCWELRRLKKWRNECTLEALLDLQSETLPVIDGYYTFLFFKSPSLWFKSLLEFKKAFM